MPKRVRPQFKRRRQTFIRAWREHRGHSQEEVAEALGSSVATISRIETGAQPYTQDTLEALAELYFCEPQDLLQRDPKNEIWSIMDTVRSLPDDEQARVAEIVKTFRRAS